MTARIALALPALLLASPPALADFLQVLCEPTEVIERRLAAYGEAVAGQGVGLPAVTIGQLWVSPTGSSWTVTMRMLDGKTCVVGMGTRWRWPAAAPKGDPM